MEMRRERPAGRGGAKMEIRRRERLAGGGGRGKRKMEMRRGRPGGQSVG